MPPMRIHRLDETLANQIAAGEVVERPAAVVKELIENALDAGARRIEVEVIEGGARLIRVRDDGAGIHRDDLVLALNRHATSKIGTFGDLERVASLGFRGEALPSIASVARLELVSSPREADAGWRVRASGSAEVEPPEPAPHPHGTTVTVRDLFFNTPARRKFLRTEKTEFRHVENVAKSLALSRFEVAVSLQHNQRRVFDLPSAGPGDQRGAQARLAKACGRDFFAAATEVEAETDGVRLHGWVSGSAARRGNELQYLFVNRRMVRDPVVRHAARQAYEGSLAAHQQPAFVLYLEVDPGTVDVNVHPTKHEVRFREARLVHDFVFRTMRRAVSGTVSMLVDPDPAGASGVPFVGSASRSGATVRPVAVQEQLAAYRALAEPTPGDSTGSDSAARQTSNSMSASSTSARAISDLVSASGQDPEASSTLGLGQAVGQIAQRYAIVVGRGGLSLVDIAAARRVVIGARLGEQIERDTVSSRPVLVPETFKLTAGQVDCLETAMPALATLGFDFRGTGPDTAMLRHAPALLADVGARRLGEALLDAILVDAARTDPSALLPAVLERCDLGPGPDLSPSTLNALLRALEQCVDLRCASSGLRFTLSLEAIESLLARSV